MKYLDTLAGKLLPTLLFGKYLLNNFQINGQFRKSCYFHQSAIRNYAEVLTYFQN